MELKRRGVPAGHYAETELEVDFITGTPAQPMPVEVVPLWEFLLRADRYL